LLLLNAGFPRADADAMVAAQSGATSPTPLSPTAPNVTPTPAAAEPLPAPGPETPSTTLPGNVTVPDTLASAFTAGDHAEATADPLRWLLLSDTVVCTDVDTSAPVSVQAVARAAIEAHRKAATRHRVQSATLLALARDLAGGRRIDAKRLHALAEWFRVRGESVKAGANYAAGGQSRHLYDLRGGDATRAWLRQLMQRIAAAHVTRAALLGDDPDAADGDDDV